MKNFFPKISIITPSFNQGQYIEQTILSVINQNYPKLEYIIIDGGSTDNTIEIIKKYEKHISYWISEADNGQSHAINKGLAKATGDIVNWLNSDDYYEPDSLRTIASVFENPKTKVFCARSNIVRDGKLLYTSHGTDIYLNNLSKTIGNARIDQPETFFRKHAFDKIGLLNEKLHCTMDREWWIRYLLEFGLDGICQSELCVVNFRLHSESKTVSQSNRFDDETLKIYYSISVNSGCKNISSELSKLYHLNGNDINTNIKINKNLSSEILNYFLLQKADQAYYNLDFKLTKENLKLIEKKLLQKVDIREYDKLSFRAKFPTWMIKLLRAND